MKSINFSKFSGAGNDFIIIDNREKLIPDTAMPEMAKKICKRKLSAGADGLIFIEHPLKISETAKDHVDFKWQFFNADGSRAEMCGNGARCAARFAYLNNMAGLNMTFQTDAGMIRADILAVTNRVKVNMTDPKDQHPETVIETTRGRIPVFSVNTGVPHVVMMVDDIENTDVKSLGREIRFHDAFAPAGTNVNFLMPKQNSIIFNRTYERGVEDETLACGTGCVASALCAAHHLGFQSPVTVRTRSNVDLAIHFTKNNDRYADIHLEGDARLIYNGTLCEDALHYA